MRAGYQAITADFPLFANPKKILKVKRSMQFSIVDDPPGASLHERALKARNELVSKLLSNWQRLAEIQLLFHEPGQAFDRISRTIDCKLEDEDRYIPSIDDEDIDGDEALLRERLEEVQHERAQVAKRVADTIIQACQEAYENNPRARTFEARIMIFARGGSLETATEQKFPASALGQLSANDPPDEFDCNVGTLDKLVGTIDRLVFNTEAGNKQLRLEKADVHQRYVELADKNMGMLDKFKDLVEMALTHAKLPPEHYNLEASKLYMRSQSQRAAMAANAKAAMAHERQQTVQAFIRENPNFIQDLLATAAHLYQQRRGAPPPGDDSAGTPPDADIPTSSEKEPHADEASPPRPDNPPTLCPGTAKLHAVLDTSTVEALKRNLPVYQWNMISPLFSCTDEAQFRRHIGTLSCSISRLPENQQAQLRAKLRDSIPSDVRHRFTEVLGSYGLRIDDPPRPTE